MPEPAAGRSRPGIVNGERALSEGEAQFDADERRPRKLGVGEVDPRHRLSVTLDGMAKIRIGQTSLDLSNQSGGSYEHRAKGGSMSPVRGILIKVTSLPIFSERRIVICCNLSVRIKTYHRAWWGGGRWTSKLGPGERIEKRETTEFERDKAGTGGTRKLLGHTQFR